MFLSIALLSIFWQVYPKCGTVGVWTWPWVGSFCEQHGHLLVDALLFCDGGFVVLRGQASSGGVHVLDKVGVVGFVGP
jgi:hypothetical protein